MVHPICAQSIFWTHNPFLYKETLWPKFWFIPPPPEIPKTCTWPRDWICIKKITRKIKYFWKPHGWHICFYQKTFYVFLGGERLNFLVEVDRPWWTNLSTFFCRVAPRGATGPPPRVHNFFNSHFKYFAFFSYFTLFKATCFQKFFIILLIMSG